MARKGSSRMPDPGGGPEVHILPQDALKGNVRQWSRDMMKNYKHLIGDEPQPESDEDFLSRGTIMLSTLNEALGLKDYMGPRADKDAVQEQFAELSHTIRPYAEFALKSVAGLIPPPRISATRTGIRKVDRAKLGRFEWDDSAINAYGPHFPMKSPYIEGDGSCGVNAVLSGAGLSTRKYNVPWLRLRGALALLSRAELGFDENKKAMFEQAITWILAEDGWLDKLAISTLALVADHQLLNIQALGVNGRFNDMTYYEMGLANETKDLDSNLLLVVFLTCPFKEKNFQNIAKKACALPAGRVVTRDYVQSLPMEDFNHFVPLFYIRGLVNLAEETAAVYNSRVSDWSDAVIRMFGGIVLVNRKVKGKYQQVREARKWWLNFLQRRKKEKKLERAKVHVGDFESGELATDDFRGLLNNKVKFARLASDLVDVAARSSRHYNLLKYLSVFLGITDSSDGFMEVFDKIVKNEETIMNLRGACELNFPPGGVSRLPQLPVATDMIGRMDFAFFSFVPVQVRSTEANYFYAGVAEFLGFKATPSVIVYLRIVALSGLYATAIRTAAGEAGLTIVPSFKRGLNKSLAPDKLLIMSLMQELKLSFRLTHTVQTGPIWDPNLLLECKDMNFAIDSPGVSRKLYFLHVDGYGFYPLVKKLKKGETFEELLIRRADAIRDATQDDKMGRRPPGGSRSASSGSSSSTPESAGEFQPSPKPTDAKTSFVEKPLKGHRKTYASKKSQDSDSSTSDSSSRPHKKKVKVEPGTSASAPPLGDDIDMPSPPPAAAMGERLPPPDFDAPKGTFAHSASMSGLDILVLKETDEEGRKSGSLPDNPSIPGEGRPSGAFGEPLLPPFAFVEGFEPGKIRIRVRSLSEGESTSPLHPQDEASMCFKIWEIYPLTTEEKEAIVTLPLPLTKGQKATITRKAAEGTLFLRQHVLQVDIRFKVSSVCVKQLYGQNFLIIESICDTETPPLDVTVTFPHFRREIDKLKKQYELDLAERQKLFDSLQRRLDRSAQAKQSIVAQLNAEVEKRELAEKTAKSLEKENKTMSREKESQQKHERELQDKVSKTTREVEKLQAKLDSANSKIADLNTKLAQGEGPKLTREKEEALEALKKEYDTKLSQAAKKHDEEIEVLHAEKASVQGEVTAVSIEYNELLEEFEALQVEKRCASREKKNCRKKLKSLCLSLKT